MNRKLSPDVLRRLLKFQRDELTGSLLYEQFAEGQKDEANRAALLEMAAAERRHCELWRRYTGRDVSPNRRKMLLYRVIRFLFGDTFTIRFFERNENFGAAELQTIEADIPEARSVIQDEEAHEARLMNMLDEERLHYLSSMVLGLNDALVELTGTIAGLTFALRNTQLVALSAIITGASATLSMAASNYLAERAGGNDKALTSCLYTGATYLLTVALLVLPFLLLPNGMAMTALGATLATVVLIILGFNYYTSVAQELPFWPRFFEMAAISLGVTALSFLIGLAARELLGVEV